MLKLSDVTLVSVSSVHLRRTIAAMAISLDQVQFADALLITHKPVKSLDRRIRLGLVEEIYSIDDYNKFIIYRLHEYIQTSHCLLVQADGYVINPRAWTKEFIEYDYIGAPWPVRPDAYIDPFGNHIRVGNGGFSLRSSHLLTVPLRQHIEWNVNKGTFYQHMNANVFSEDGNICVHNRHVYEREGCRFAPIEIAARFSSELRVPEAGPGIPFGFHKRKPPHGRRHRAPIWKGWSWFSK